MQITKTRNVTLERGRRQLRKEIKLEDNNNNVHKDEMTEMNEWCSDNINITLS